MQERKIGRESSSSLRVDNHSGRELIRGSEGISHTNEGDSSKSHNLPTR